MKTFIFLTLILSISANGFCGEIDRNFRVNIQTNSESSDLITLLTFCMRKEVEKIRDVVLVTDNPNYTVNLTALNPKHCNNSSYITLGASITKHFDLSFLKDELKEPISPSTLEIINSERNTQVAGFIYNLSPQEVPAACAEIATDFDNRILAPVRKLDMELLKLLLEETNPAGS